MTIQASTAAAPTFSDAYGIASAPTPNVGALLRAVVQGLAVAAVQPNSVRRSENARDDDQRLTALRGKLPEKRSLHGKTAAPCALLRAAPSRSARAANASGGTEVE